MMPPPLVTQITPASHPKHERGCGSRSWPGEDAVGTRQYAATTLKGWGA